jgi:hypothetical protein
LSERAADQTPRPGIGLPEAICNHTFRATGITAYHENGGTIVHTR